MPRRRRRRSRGSSLVNVDEMNSTLQNYTRSAYARGGPGIQVRDDDQHGDESSIKVTQRFVQLVRVASPVTTLHREDGAGNNGIVRGEYRLPEERRPEE